MGDQLTSMQLLGISVALMMYMLLGLMAYWAIEMTATLVSKARAWVRRRRRSHATAVEEAIEGLRRSRDLVDLELSRLERWRNEHANSIPSPGPADGGNEPQTTQS